jgi:hypothetical protein
VFDLDRWWRVWAEFECWYFTVMSFRACFRLLVVDSYLSVFYYDLFNLLFRSFLEMLCFESVFFYDLTWGLNGSVVGWLG